MELQILQPSPKRKHRLGNVAAMAKLIRKLPPSQTDSVAHRRKLVADFCKILGQEFSQPQLDRAVAGLSPRHAQTLRRLLHGDSEKQIARHLRVSPNTVHVYVKGLHRHFGVSSRGELLCRFLPPAGVQLGGIT